MIARLSTVLLLIAAGCATTDTTGGGAAPTIDPRHAGWWVWHTGEGWRVRAVPDGKSHRFQGTLVGTGGSITEAVASSPQLYDRIAVVGDEVAFDFDSARESVGVDVKVAGGCLRFDLLLDGKRRAERIHVGARGRSPKGVPFDRCP